MKHQLEHDLSTGTDLFEKFLIHRDTPTYQKLRDFLQDIHDREESERNASGLQDTPSDLIGGPETREEGEEGSEGPEDLPTV